MLFSFPITKERILFALFHSRFEFLSSVPNFLPSVTQDQHSTVLHLNSAPYSCVSLTFFVYMILIGSVLKRVLRIALDTHS